MNTEKLLELMLENPETVPVLISELINKYKPTIYAVAKEVVEIMKDYANSTEYFETCAKIKRQQFDAYVNAGFTEEQAIAFIINDNLKLMEQVKNSSSKISNKK